MRFKNFILPIILVFCLIFVGQVCSQEVERVITDPTQTTTFTWDANTETNLAGYNLYYASTREAIDSDSFPLGLGITQVPVTITAGMTEVTIDPLPINGDYHFCLTAYNTIGHESGPSDATCCYIKVEYPPEVPANPKGFGCVPII